MKNNFLALILPTCALFLMPSCGNGELSKEEKWKKREETVKVASLPSISFEEMQVIYDSCDYIDFIFYNVDFSMSINDKSNIQRTVAFATPTVPTLNPNCKAMGRVFFQTNGTVLIEADMYQSEECNYFVFHKNGKPTYANAISAEGQAYFKKIFSQVKVEPSN